MPKTAMDHLVLMVADLDRSVAWYDAFMPLVGFEKTREHVYQHTDGWAADLRPAGEEAQPYGRYNVGLNHIGLSVADNETVLAIRRAFAKKGFDVPDPQTFDDWATVVFFRDPDGMRWEVGPAAPEPTQQ